FIAADKKQIKRAKETGAEAIEIHTGVYANAKTKQEKTKELKKITAMTQYALTLGLIVNAGHGLKYHDTMPIARIPGINELNIGHSIISRAVFVGLHQAVKEMLALIKK
ncbi:MAG TPA: pyridoxine 5'-phosphate synthase, partial [Candidatus Omnitrophota bacterium]|nr:pyridoxine 5'-phosphate synthase [Candidatus Omnitrophota bacterium]